MSEILLFCHLSWVTGEWETCSASCGQTGWQRRWVSCQQTSSRGQQQQRSVHSKLCGEDRPDGKQTCNRFPCPASWRAGPWTPVRPVKPGDYLLSHKVILPHGVHSNGWTTSTFPLSGLPLIFFFLDYLQLPFPWATSNFHHFGIPLTFVFPNYLYLPSLWTLTFLLLDNFYISLSGYLYIVSGLPLTVFCLNYL